MPTQGLKRLLLFLATALVVTAGCASAPKAVSQTEPPAASGVVQASANEPARPPESSSVVPATGIAEAAPDANDAEPEPKDEGYSLSDFSPDNIGKTVKKMAGYGPNRQIAEALMREGEQFFREKNYTEAQKRFHSAASRWPDSPLEEDALFLKAECLFFSDQYPKAQDAYDETLKKHENSRHLDTICKRLFAIGQYWEQLEEKTPHWPVTPNLTDKKRPWFDTFGNGLRAYESVRLHDPIGPLADDAVMATANAHFRWGHWEKAAYNYDVLCKEYPKSDHQIKAHLLGMEAKKRVYQGQFYDATPLKDREALAEQTLLQFGPQLGQERRRVEETRREITEEWAAREWAMAEFYDKKECYRAARHYYQDLMKKYPQSQYAQRAAARLDEIRDKPDEPPNNFRWLTDLFPEKE